MSGLSSNSSVENDNYTILLHLILSINSYYGYKNLIIISNTDDETNYEFNSIIGQIEGHLHTAVPVIIYTVSKRLRLNRRINKDTLSLVFLDPEFEADLNQTHKLLLGFRTNKSVFVINNEGSKNESSLQSFAEWLWKEQFVNSIILWNNEIFGFDPFPELRITTPEIKEYFSFRETTGYNLKGYFLHTPVITSTPRLFPVKDENGKDVLTGVNGYLFMHFLEFMNMTWEGFDEEYWMKVSNESGENDLESMGLYSVQSMSAEIAAYSPLIISSKFIFDNSYPTGIVDSCLMLPVYNALASQLYILRPFSMDLWVLLIILTFYATVALYIVLNLTYFREQYFDFFICFQQILNIIFLNSSNVLAFSLPSSTWIILFLPLFIMGFTMYSFYTTYLAAFLTTIIFDEDIETMDQLLLSNIKILAIYWQIDDLLEHYNMENITRKNFISVKYKDQDSVLKERSKLNTSYGYMAPSDMWNIYAKEQELLRRPLFQFSEICYTTFYASFPIKQDSYIEQPLKYLIMVSQQFGLLKAWADRSFRDATRAGIFHLFKDNTLNDFDALSPSFFVIGFWILLGGFVLSGISFLIELFVKAYHDKKLFCFRRKQEPEYKNHRDNLQFKY